jgi:hypothetical protein
VRDGQRKAESLHRSVVARVQEAARHGAKIPALAEIVDRAGVPLRRGETARHFALRALTEDLRARLTGRKPTLAQRLKSAEAAITRVTNAA